MIRDEAEESRQLDLREEYIAERIAIHTTRIIEALQTGDSATVAVIDDRLSALSWDKEMMTGLIVDTACGLHPFRKLVRKAVAERPKSAPKKTPTNQTTRTIENEQARCIPESHGRSQARRRQQDHKFRR